MGGFSGIGRHNGHMMHIRRWGGSGGYWAAGRTIMRRRIGTMGILGREVVR